VSFSLLLYRLLSLLKLSADRFLRGKVLSHAPIGAAHLANIQVSFCKGHHAFLKALRRMLVRA
jgi:hypothetical protein